MTPYDRRLNPFINRMAQDMQIRNLAASTIDSYTWHVDKFCSHFGKMPEELGLDEIRLYQLFLVNDPARARRGQERPVNIRCFSRHNLSASKSHGVVKTCHRPISRID
ncbi:MAG: phage integrase N-terminal SAM-like domain-containing protein [Pirellulaceae bacterium]